MKTENRERDHQKKRRRKRRQRNADRRGRIGLRLSLSHGLQVELVPDRRRQVFGGPGHHRDVQHGLIGISLQVTQDEYVVVLENQTLTGHPPLEGARGVAVVHASVPIGQHVLREFGVEMHHAEAKVGVIKVEIVRNRPHGDEVDVLVAQFPGDDAAGSGDGVLLVDRDDDFPVSGEHFPLVISELESPVLGESDWEREHPFGPVFNRNEAANFDALRLLLSQISKSSVVEVA